jgi:hypothetical protein
VFTGSPDPSAVTNATGLWHNIVQVPNVPALSGISVWGQVFVFSFLPLPSNGLFFIGNALQITFVP